MFADVVMWSSQRAHLKAKFDDIKEDKRSMNLIQI